jgi:hypothetical protein
MRSLGRGGGRFSVPQCIRTLAPGERLFLRLPCIAPSFQREIGTFEKKRAEGIENNFKHSV